MVGVPAPVCYAAEIVKKALLSKETYKAAPISHAADID
jgi:hypothetical protein